MNLHGTSATCIPRSIYTGTNIPNGLNDAIKSITLNKGYMATLAENIDGTGERFTYMATQRMCSPVCTESQYRVWLDSFYTVTNQQMLDVDVICVHWYDWGNWLSTLNVNPSATSQMIETSTLGKAIYFVRLLSSDSMENTPFINNNSYSK